jgi:hypothetical protein
VKTTSAKRNWLKRWTRKQWEVVGRGRKALGRHLKSIRKGVGR